MQFDSDFRVFLSENLLSTTKVAESLQVSRQRVLDLVKEGKLDPVYRDPGGYIFLRADIEAFKQRDSRKFHFTEPKFIELSGTTRRSVEHFRSHIHDLGNIQSVFIYFDSIDAAHDQFFLPIGQYYGQLQAVQTPFMVLRDENGDEMWLGGCNCGYGGEGPHGSATILKELNFSDHYIDYVFRHRIVKLIRDADEVDVFYSESLFKELKKPALVDDHASLFLSKDRLVLLQSESSRSDELLVLHRYRNFLPNPTEVLLLTDEQARNLGYVSIRNRTFGNFYGEVTYNVIIRDYSGRELWLNTFISNKPLLRQNSILELLRTCGFKPPESSLIADFQGWLQTIVRKRDPNEPLYRITRSK